MVQPLYYFSVVVKYSVLEIAALYEIYKQHPSVQTDTRKLKEGDMFFCIEGPEL